MRAERQAEWLLRFKFYRILARNYRVRNGEIDLVARRGSVVAFIEVKARPELLQGLESVTGRKQKRVSRAARHWLARNPWAMACTLRGDGIFVVPRRLPRHITNLFELQLE